MGIDWYRHYHGTAADPKWRVVARRSGQPVCCVIAMWNMMCERASTAHERGHERGCIADLDLEVIGAALDLEVTQCDAIVQAMAGLVHDGQRLTAWERRQPKREDSSADRTREWRHRHGRDVTQRDAQRRSVTPKIREDKIREDSEQNAASAASRARVLADAKKREEDASHGELIRRVLHDTGLDRFERWVSGDQSGTILGWLQDGCLLSDIVPAIRAAMARRDNIPPKSLGYFSPAVRESYERNRSLPEKGGRNGGVSPAGAEAGAGGAEGGHGVGLRRKARWGIVDGSP